MVMGLVMVLLGLKKVGHWAQALRLMNWTLGGNVGPWIKDLLGCPMGLEVKFII
jgi:hypothetical protein